MKIDWKNRKVRAVVVLLTLWIFVIGCFFDTGKYGLKNLWYRIKNPELSSNPYFNKCIHVCEDPHSTFALTVYRTWPITHGAPCIQGCEKDFSENEADARTKAEKGDPQGQYSLGWHYSELGNYTEAFKWFRLAALQGNGIAQAQIGLMYFNGQGVERNYEEAYFWLLHTHSSIITYGASEMAFNQARDHLSPEQLTAAWNRLQEWLPTHPDTTVLQMQIKAETGDRVEGSYLGIYYAEGTRVKQDWEKAYFWLSMSGGKDPRNEAASRLTPEQISAIDKHAQEWMQKDFKSLKSKAELGDRSAQWRLGFLYQYGDGVQQNFAQAAKWYRLSATQGIPDAQYRLGRFYTEGKGVKKDNVEAYFWLALAKKEERWDESLANLAGNVASQLTPEQMKEVETRLKNWKPLLSEAGAPKP